MEKIAHPGVDERVALGRAAREQVSPSGHSGWVPAAGRPDPVALLEEQDATREPDLVPVRHGRMAVSPFTFYRGAAKIMAADLKDTPTAGLSVQLCGDAHLSNFGVFASPERTLVFGLNDFDETLPGPFEYDVKRLAASLTIAARNNSFTKAAARTATLASVQAYRERMADFAAMTTLDVWYAHLSEEELLRSIKRAVSEKKEGKEKGFLKHAEKSVAKQAQKARTRDSLQALSKLAEIVDGRHRIVSQPPIVIPLRELGPIFGRPEGELEQIIHDQFRAYRRTLPDDRRRLYWRQLRDMKGSAVIETMVPPALAFYGRVCGRTLARAHARSGDPVALAAYLGKKDRFEQSITDFAERYADQNERDYQAFASAIQSGRLAALNNV